MTTTLSETTTSTALVDTGCAQEALMTMALRTEKPRCYAASVFIAFHYDPVTGDATVSTPAMAASMGRCDRSAARYKAANLLIWDLVAQGPHGNATYRLSQVALKELEANEVKWSETGGRYAVLRPDMLGDGTQWDNTARFGVDPVVEAEYDFLTPAARVNRADMVGGPVMAQFVASIQHRSQTDGALLGKLLWDLDPRQGASEVNREELKTAMRLGYMKSLERKVRVLARETGLVEVTHTDTGYRTTPSEMFCAAWDTWANRR